MKYKISYCYEGTTEGTTQLLTKVMEAVDEKAVRTIFQDVYGSNRACTIYNIIPQPNVGSTGYIKGQESKLKILIFALLTSYLVPPFAVSSTIDSARYENDKKMWQTLLSWKELKKRQNLHNRFSEVGGVLFKNCKKQDYPFTFPPVEACLSVSDVKINCYKNVGVTVKSIGRCNIVLEYFASITHPRLDSMAKFDFGGYVELDFISDGVMHKKSIDFGNPSSNSIIVGPNQFDGAKGFKKYSAFFDTFTKVTEVNLADISFNIKNLLTHDKPTPPLVTQ